MPLFSCHDPKQNRRAVIHDAGAGLPQREGDPEENEGDPPFVEKVPNFGGKICARLCNFGKVKFFQKKPKKVLTKEEVCGIIIGHPKKAGCEMDLEN